MKKEYLVKMENKNHHTETLYSMFGFIMFTGQIESAKRYTEEEAYELIKSIPSHMGKGVAVEV